MACQLQHSSQVLAVGDFNIAATKKDVYPGLDLDSCYAQEELAGMHEILQDYPDMWRLQHPDADNCFTVWDFKTGARGVNQVRLQRRYIMQTSHVSFHMGWVPSCHGRPGYGL